VLERRGGGRGVEGYGGPTDSLRLLDPEAPCEKHFSFFFGWPEGWPAAGFGPQGGPGGQAIPVGLEGVRARISVSALSSGRPNGRVGARPGQRFRRPGRR